MGIHGRDGTVRWATTVLRGGGGVEGRRRCRGAGVGGGDVLKRDCEGGGRWSEGGSDEPVVGRPVVARRRAVGGR